MYYVYTLPLNILEYTVVFENPIGLISQNLTEARIRKTMGGKVLRQSSRMILFLWVSAISAYYWNEANFWLRTFASKLSILMYT